MGTLIKTKFYEKKHTTRVANIDIENEYRRKS